MEPTQHDLSQSPPVAVVTGATGAIGGATASRLVADGWRVALIGRDEARLEALAGSLGPPALGLAADVLSAASLEAVIGVVNDRLGPPTALVHAVGSTLLKPAHAIRDEDFATVIETNLTSAFYALRSFVRAVPRGQPASAVFFSTAATRIGLMNHEAIAAAKGGIDGLVTAAAATYAPRRIRFNAVAPGLVRSGLTRRLVESPGTLAASEQMHPLGRIGKPDDVAGLAAFLVSPAAAWITGQVIAADGGLSGVKLPPVARATAGP